MDLPLSDQELITATLQGDPEAFGELARRHQDRLSTAVRGVLNQPEDIQDAVQEGQLLLAYQSLPRFRQDSDVYTWLYRIAMNAAVSLRRGTRRPLTGLDVGQPFPGLLDLADESGRGEPAAALEAAERLEKLGQALGRLNNRDRVLVVMKDLEGMAYQTIASALAIPFGTVRSRLHRARVRLRAAMEDLTVRERDP